MPRKVLLQALKAAPSGVYCGPLRLLALEVFERLNKEQLPCDLVTGQERTEVPNAKHVSCTVEMASTAQLVDVAVIDEIQARLPASACNPALQPRRASWADSLSADDCTWRTCAFSTCPTLAGNRIR